MNKGGYDIGYMACNCFWGTNPGSLLIKLNHLDLEYKKKIVLDLGCGEGKNAFYFAQKGCLVEAYDISEYAISNAKKFFGDNPNVSLIQADITSLEFLPDYYDIIVAYGLFHCLNSREDVIRVIKRCLTSLKNDGYFIVCAFNSRSQDMSAHEGFLPLLLSHKDYLTFFSNYLILFESDEDLTETHPHNRIKHTHSMTRIIIKKAHELPS